jgi:hypothetical protein
MAHSGMFANMQAAARLPAGVSQSHAGNRTGSALSIVPTVNGICEVTMAKRSKDEMLPAVRGCTIDIDDKDAPTCCLVGLLTEDGVKSFTLGEHGARTMMLALQSFLDRLAPAKANPRDGNRKAN